jgi:hypothetical protein
MPDSPRPRLRDSNKEHLDPGFPSLRSGLDPFQYVPGTTESGPRYLKRRRPRGCLINGLLRAMVGSSSRHKYSLYRIVRESYDRHRHSRSKDLRYSQGETMKILEEMWMVELEYPNHPITGSGSSMCLAIPHGTGAFESPFLAS